MHTQLRVTHYKYQQKNKIANRQLTNYASHGLKLSPSIGTVCTLYQQLFSERKTRERCCNLSLKLIPTQLRVIRAKLRVTHATINTRTKQQIGGLTNYASHWLKLLPSLETICTLYQELFSVRLTQERCCTLSLKLIPTQLRQLRVTNATIDTSKTIAKS